MVVSFLDLVRLQIHFNSAVQAITPISSIPCPTDCYYSLAFIDPGVPTLSYWTQSRQKMGSQNPRQSIKRLKKQQKIDSGESGPTVWTYLMPLNCTLKNGGNNHFYVMHILTPWKILKSKIDLKTKQQTINILPQFSVFRGKQSSHREMVIGGQANLL